MHFKRWLALATVASLTFLIAGCGGAQNPLQIPDADVPGIVDGFWDGLTFLVALVVWLISEIFDPNDYGVIRDHFGTPYLVGYIIGFLLQAYLIYRFIWPRRRVVYRRRRRRA